MKLTYSWSPVLFNVFSFFNVLTKMLSYINNNLLFDRLQEFYLDRAAPKPAFRSHFCALTHPSFEVWPFDFAKVLPQQKTKVN